MSDWGVKTSSGIVTVASRGEEQARMWADYKHPTVSYVGEELVRFDGQDWVTQS